MQITYQYYYHNGKSMTKAVIYIILSVLMVAFAVFCYRHWDLSFMLSEWQGYLLIIPYFFITLGVILSVFENFKKVKRTNRGIPAFAIGDKHFVFFDNTGIANVIPFEDCEYVKIKKILFFYRTPSLYFYKLTIKYYDKADTSSNFEIKLSELDHPQDEIKNQVKNIYDNY